MLPSYTVGIATRNRYDALELALPRYTEQTVVPEAVVIVDSSDDHERVRQIAHKSFAHTSIKYSVIRSERGIVLQRNRAIAETNTPIIFLPDDDSILFPDTAEQMLKAYTCDRFGAVTAVCAAESFTPPPGILESTKASYQISSEDKLRRGSWNLRRSIERLLPEDPAAILGKSFWPPQFLENDDSDFRPVAWMTGFRMSFRTDVIKQFGFNTAFTGYSLFEDIDASVEAWKRGAVVAALKAKIYHHRSPERRGKPEVIGAVQLLNKAYIVARHTAPGHPARKAVRWFVTYKLLLYGLNIGSRYGRERFFGALRYANEALRIAGSKQADARSAYESATKKLHDWSDRRKK